MSQKTIPYERSFATHPKSEHWHPTKNGDVKPRDVFKGAGMAYWFICDKCSHPFKVSLDNVSGKGRWCPYCAHRKLCSDKNCSICYNKSFASHHRSEHWHPTKNGNVTPRDVFKGSNKKKYWFICDICHDVFDITLNGIYSHGNWCSCVINKTEAKFYEYLQVNEDRLKIKSIKKNFRPKWANLRKTHDTFYEYDFYIVLTNDVKIIIEIDGRQHYIQVSNWSIPLHNQIRDKIKEMLAVKQQINLIRLNQEDVYTDKNGWEDIIKNFLYERYNDNNTSIHIYDCSFSQRYL